MSSLDHRQRYNTKQVSSSVEQPNLYHHDPSSNHHGRVKNKKWLRSKCTTMIISLAVLMISLLSFILFHPPPSSSNLIYKIKKKYQMNNNYLTFSYQSFFDNNEDTSTKYINNEILFLGKESVSSLLKKEKLLFDHHRQQQQQQSSLSNNSNHKIDVLVVGSKNAMELVKAQRETWASHSSIRHFFLSTEDDETHPMCSNTTTNNETTTTTTKWSDKYLRSYSMTCQSKQFWTKMKALNKFTMYIKNTFARMAWLQKKKNPQGWLCVQRRFVTSFTSLIQLYSKTQSLPDYLIVADDDTYVNIDHIIEDMILDPIQRSKGNDDVVVFPPFDTPVVTAGCRVRAPHQTLAWTLPFGGFGTFLSKGSLNELIQPLYCNQTDTTNIMEPKCQKLLFNGNNNNNHDGKISYPLSGTIGEGTYFQNGDTLNQVFYKYSRQVEHFCLHSDWFLAYLTNFYNISQHTSGSLNNWFDNENEHVQENRLYSFKDSEIYYPNRPPKGQCKYSGEHLGTDCNINSTVCHRVKASEMKQIHSILKR